MAQPYADMAHLAAGNPTDFRRNTIRDFVLQHNTALFAPGGMCSRLLELEHQVLALSVRLAALESVQHSGRGETDERPPCGEQPEPELQAPTPTLSSPLLVTQAIGTAVQETIATEVKALVHHRRRTRTRKSASTRGAKHEFSALPIIQVTFGDSEKSISRETRPSSSLPNPSVSSSLPIRNKSLKSSSNSSQTTRPRKRRRTSSRSARTATDEAIDSNTAELICCDQCSQWFHIDCADVLPDDPRMTMPDVPFICANCIMRSSDNAIIEPTDKNACGRKGCTRPVEAGEGEFVVERIIGKRTLQGDGGSLVEYLIKWEGYSAPQADWRTGDDMGSTFRVLCSDFERQAVVEGVPKTGSQTLLKEAIDAGWT